MRVDRMQYASLEEYKTVLSRPNKFPEGEGQLDHMVTQEELLLRRFLFSSGQLASKRFKQHKNTQEIPEELLWPRTKEHSVNPNEAPCNANCVTFCAGGNKCRTQYLDANLSRSSHLKT